MKALYVILAILLVVLLCTMCCRVSVVQRQPESSVLSPGDLILTYVYQTTTDGQVNFAVTTESATGSDTFSFPHGNPPSFEDLQNKSLPNPLGNLHIYIFDVNRNIIADGNTTADGHVNFSIASEEGNFYVDGWNCGSLIIAWNSSDTEGGAIYSCTKGDQFIS